MRNRKILIITLNYERVCAQYVQTNLDNIHLFINRFDNIKILEKLQLAFLTNENLEYNRLFDSGGIFFLTGLMLKKEKNSLPDPSIEVLNNLIKTLMYYIDHYYLKIFERIKSENTDQATKEFKVKLYSFKLLNQVNYGGYQFQYDDFGMAVFGKLDSFFEQKIGFNFSDAMKFIQYVESQFESVFERNQSKIRSILNSHKADKTSNGKVLYDLPLFDIKIDPLAIQRTNSLNEELLNRFMKFLDFLSIKFGDQYSAFNNLLDKNVMFEKPLIKRNNKYYCPSVHLLWDHHVYFANIMKNEMSNNTRTGKKYTEIKSNYLEEKTVEFLRRIFPPGSVFSNLYYFPENTNRSFETDVLIKHGSVIVILEAKTGELSDAALRGAPKSLTKDLSKMLGKAYDQGKRIQDFILDEKPARFYNNDKTKLLLEIDKKKPLTFLICNITLYPLRALSTNIVDLDSLGLFPINEYPVSLSLFDIDILTQFIPNGSLFIDYLNKRKDYKFQNPLLGSEIQFLNGYLKNQTFEGLESIMNPKLLHDPFDSYFLLNGGKPKLELEPHLFDLISAIDMTDRYDKSEIIGTIIAHKGKLIANLSAKIEHLIKDSSNKPKQFYSLTLETYEFVFTFLNEKANVNNLDKELMNEPKFNSDGKLIKFEYNIMQGEYTNISFLYD